MTAFTQFTLIERRLTERTTVCSGQNDYSWWRMGTVDFPYVHSDEDPVTTGVSHCRDVWIKRIPIKEVVFEGDIEIAKLSEYVT